MKYIIFFPFSSIKNISPFDIMSMPIRTPYPDSLPAPTEMYSCSGMNMESAKAIAALYVKDIPKPPAFLENPALIGFIPRSSATHWKIDVMLQPVSQRAFTMRVLPSWDIRVTGTVIRFSSLSYSADMTISPFSDS